VDPPVRGRLPERSLPGPRLVLDPARDGERAGRSGCGVLEPRVQRHASKHNLAAAWLPTPGARRLLTRLEGRAAGGERLAPISAPRRPVRGQRVEVLAGYAAPLVAVRVRDRDWNRAGTGGGGPAVDLPRWGESAPLSDQMNGACPVPGLVSTAAKGDRGELLSRSRPARLSGNWPVEPLRHLTRRRSAVRGHVGGVGGGGLGVPGGVNSEPLPELSAAERDGCPPTVVWPLPVHASSTKYPAHCA